MIRVLQTRALPLGHVAIQEVICLIKKRAGSETRTRDLLLGKEVFYQLNYTRALSFVDSQALLIINIDYYTAIDNSVKKFMKIRLQMIFCRFSLVSGAGF